MSDLFYNTIHEKGPELEKSREKVYSQEESILSFFELFPGPHTPSAVYDWFKPRKKWPMRSIGRAITNLTKKEKLVKTDTMAMGPHKKREHLWKLKGE